ncbi:MAG: GNAT family N-acetyltransferase [Alphaproteobacteria bacterium]
MTIPTLNTARLTLRPMNATDWDAYHGLMASDRAMYIGGPFSKSMAWGMFCADHAQWSLFGCGALMIEDTATGKCLGQVGINYGPLFPEWELGWFVYQEAEGQSIAYEAALALRDWAYKTRHLETLVSYIDPENIRSAKLAERLGAKRDATAKRPDSTDLVYRHFGKANTIEKIENRPPSPRNITSHF